MVKPAVKSVSSSIRYLTRPHAIRPPLIPLSLFFLFQVSVVPRRYQPLKVVECQRLLIDGFIFTAVCVYVRK